jgi:cytochrome P450
MTSALSDHNHRPVVSFDHHSAEFNADPHAAWLALQETPVVWSEDYGGFWVISDHQGNYDVLQNTDVFTSERVLPTPSLTVPSFSSRASDEPILPMELDPPHHGPVRQLLNAGLSPGASRKMQPIIEHWATTCIDAVIEAGECDLLYDITGPVPAYVTMDWLGFPHDRILEAAETVHHLVGYPPGSEECDKARQSTMIEQTLWETCAARRKEPHDDLISRLMTQEVDGKPVTDSIIVRLAYVLVVGGVDTTTSLTSSALVHLNRHRELRQRLIDDPALIESATEEFLRVYPPLSSIARAARKDFEYRGCQVQSGDRVLVSRHAGNYDEKVFDCPEEFRADRFPNRHVSFGLGPHRCVGSHLARLMFQEVLRQVLRRMPDYELDESGVAPYPDRGLFEGWTALPARFSPGPRAR